MQDNQVLDQPLEIVSCTDVGLQRAHNEDAIGFDATLGVLVLADGMGGYNAGEVASQLAVTHIMASLKEALHQQSPPQQAIANLPAEAHYLFDAVNIANEAIYQHANNHAECAGMGTTLVMGLFTQHQLLVGHIGDARMYRLRHFELTRLTEDHSVIQAQINAGEITVAEARAAPHKNLVTRALGIDIEAQLTCQALDVEVGDVYLLCSDGLTDLVEDNRIAATLNMLSSDLTRSAQKLVDIANESGGLDNISVLLVRVNAPFVYQAPGYQQFLRWFK